MTLENEPTRRTPLAAQLLGHSGPQGPDELRWAAPEEHAVGDDQAYPYDEDELAAGEPGPEPLRVLVLDRKGSFSADIRRAAHQPSHDCEIVVEAHPTRLMEQVAAWAPDVLLAAPEEMTPTGLRRIAQVHRAAPKCIIALTQTSGGPVISMTDAATCGASEALMYPSTPARLRHALGRILLLAESLPTERVVIKEVVSHVPAPQAAAEHAPAPPASAKVFTVTSPTGGCGKTFFATNLAAYLAGVTGGRVLLLDLDLQFGEVSLALGLRPQRTISELINEESLLEAFPEYVVEHSAGYQVLSAPADPFAAELVGPREATRVLEAARALFDYIVVDTPPSLNEVVLAAFDQSRYLVVMATMDVPSLRNLKVFLETIDRLKLPAEDVSCVLNKAEPDNGIDLEELLRVYPGGFAAVLPYAKEVSRSLNLGKPVLMVDARADISQKILEAGTKLVPASEIKNPNWLARPAGRSGWSGRRKDRHAAPPAPLPPAAPQPTYQAGPAYQAPGYQTGAAYQPDPEYQTGPAYQPGPAYQGEMGYQPGPGYPPAAPAQEATRSLPELTFPPSRASELVPAGAHERASAPPATSNAAGAPPAAGPSYAQPMPLPPTGGPVPPSRLQGGPVPTTGPAGRGSDDRRGWLSRIFHRGGTPPNDRGTGHGNGMETVPVLQALNVGPAAPPPAPIPMVPPPAPPPDFGGPRPDAKLVVTGSKKGVGQGPGQGQRRSRPTEVPSQRRKETGR